MCRQRPLLRFRGSLRVPLRLNLKCTSSLLESWPPSPALNQMMAALLHNPPSGDPTTAEQQSQLLPCVTFSAHHCCAESAVSHLLLLSHLPYTQLTQQAFEAT